MIQVIDLETTPKYLQEINMDKESFINSSSIVGGNTPIIILGFYDSIEKKRISFFHELGHILVLNKLGWLSEGKDKDKFNKEKQAWDAAYELADTLGIEFSKECKNWAKEQLDTYKEKEN